MPIREIRENFAIDDIVPYFQPIIDLHSQRVWRYECLARLIMADDKTFLPSEFLYLIEREKHIHDLTEAMFSRSAHYFRDLNIPWSINISEADLLNQNLTQTLITHVSNYPNPSRVSIEVSATSAVNNRDAMRQFVDHCLHTGIGVFIDNVGTKPGNIKELLRLPIRGIKLAGGLIRHYETDDAAKEYVNYVLSLCEERHISVVAEHIETTSLLECVKQLPIRYAQGYVFSPPAPKALHH